MFRLIYRHTFESSVKDMIVLCSVPINILCSGWSTDTPLNPAWRTWLYYVRFQPVSYVQVDLQTHLWIQREGHDCIMFGSNQYPMFRLIYRHTFESSVKDMIVLCSVPTNILCSGWSLVNIDSSGDKSCRISLIGRGAGSIEAWFSSCIWITMGSDDSFGEEGCCACKPFNTLTVAAFKAKPRFEVKLGGWYNRQRNCSSCTNDCVRFMAYHSCKQRNLS